MKKYLIMSVVIILLIIIGGWVFLYIGLLIGETPKKPVNIYGEFPFILTYEINGEIKVIQDIIVCTYDGIGLNEASGKYRKWSSVLKSGNNEIILLKINDTFEIYYNHGSAQYYMGDIEQLSDLSANPIGVRYKEKVKNIFNKDGSLDAETLWNTYAIRIISWECAPPIHNVFK